MKPSDVLVTMQDGVPPSKVSDFWGCQSYEPKLTKKTLFTSCWTMIGTLANLPRSVLTERFVY